MNSKQLGASGEAHVARYLQSEGYTVIETNVRPFPGMERGEIDIVAMEGAILCFVEVKTRVSRRLSAELGVTLAKRKQLVRLANAYLSVRNLDPDTCRFDVVSVYSDPRLPSPMISLHKDAFSPAECQ